ncbi:hypothetical protein LCGC14_0701000, partial [marine sediment metagenome]
MTISLILGGVKSGKSALAERVASATKLNVSYIATATADDLGMQQRIQHPGQTIKSWTGSNRPVFELPLMFIRVR